MIGSGRSGIARGPQGRGGKWGRRKISALPTKLVTDDHPVLPLILLWGSHMQSSTLESHALVTRIPRNCGLLLPHSL